MNERADTIDRLDLPVVLSFTKTCNFACFFCYATYNDIDGNKLLLIPEAELFEIVRLLARRFAKITFVGGEPTLYARLNDLVALAKAEGAMTDVVTNGSKVNEAWLQAAAPNLDFLTLSIDSSVEQTHRVIGRQSRAGKVISSDQYIQIAELTRKAGIEVKVNTVVNSFNVNESLSELVSKIKPRRWKILEADTVKGQNEQNSLALVRNRPAFDSYVDRHRAELKGSGVRIVPMPIELIRGSYIVVSPEGRFIDNVDGEYRYSEPILVVGIDKARAQVSFDREKLIERDGDADFVFLTDRLEL